MTEKEQEDLDFFNYFYGNVSGSYKETYEKAEWWFTRLKGYRKFASYDSFRNAKARYLKRLRKK